MRTRESCVNIDVRQAARASCLPQRVLPNRRSGWGSLSGASIDGCAERDSESRLARVEDPRPGACWDSEAELLQEVLALPPARPPARRRRRRRRRRQRGAGAAGGAGAAVAVRTRVGGADAAAVGAPSPPSLTLSLRVRVTLASGPGSGQAWPGRLGSPSAPS